MVFVEHKYYLGIAPLRHGAQFIWSEFRIPSNLSKIFQVRARNLNIWDMRNSQLRIKIGRLETEGGK